MRSLQYLNGILTVLAVLLALHCWVLLAGTPAATDLLPANSAHAQGVGGAAQRQVEVVDQLKAVHKTVESIDTQLRAGLEVRVTSMPTGD